VFHFPKEDEVRNTLILIGMFMLAALGITIWAQQAPPTDLSPIMKDVGATQNKLRMDLMSGNASDVAADAEKLQNDFRQAGGFFKAHNAHDAADWAKANVQSAGEIMKAAKANNLDAAKAPANEIQKSCKNCHDVHREQLPDKTFKFK
jgi:cytochrome c556